jgi:shikimate kinase
MNDMKLTVSQNIFLTGFMGAGKTTSGHSLARLTGCPFHDLDSLIVDREKRSIANIFKTDGEEYFRNCETMVLSSLAENTPAIYATGGGIVVREENRAMMRRKGRIVCLRASWETLRERLQDSVDRPLVVQAKSWYDLEQLWLSRMHHYDDADLIVDTDDLSPMQVARKIVSLLQSETKE